MEHDVTNIDTEEKKVTAKDLKTNKEMTVDYDKLVVTTGSWPIIPPIKGIEEKIFYYVKIITKQMSLLNKLRKPKKSLSSVVVISGSNWSKPLLNRETGNTD